MKLKDVFNKKVNSRNKQVSFDVRKRKLNEFEMDIDDLMDMDITRSTLNKLKKRGFEY